MSAFWGVKGVTYLPPRERRDLIIPTEKVPRQLVATLDLPAVLLQFGLTAASVLDPALTKDIAAVKVLAQILQRFRVELAAGGGTTIIFSGSVRTQIIELTTQTVGFARTEELVRLLDLAECAWNATPPGVSSASSIGDWLRDETKDCLSVALERANKTLKLLPNALWEQFKGGLKVIPEVFQALRDTWKPWLGPDWAHSQSYLGFAKTNPVDRLAEVLPQTGSGPYSTPRRLDKNGYEVSDVLPVKFGNCADYSQRAWELGAGWATNEDESDFLPAFAVFPVTPSSAKALSYSFQHAKSKCVVYSGEPSDPWTTLHRVSVGPATRYGDGSVALATPDSAYYWIAAVSGTIYVFAEGDADDAVVTKVLALYCRLDYMYGTNFVPAEIRDSTCARWMNKSHPQTSSSG